MGYWALARNKTVILPVLIFLIASNNLWNNFQFTLFKSESRESINILTYNVQQFKEQIVDNTTNTKEGILTFIMSENPDILCIQEYHSRSANLYEPLKEIRDTLGMESYYYESYFNPKYDNLVGLAVFSKKKAVNKGKLKFEGSRTFGIFIDILLNGDTTRVYNIHLASIKLTPADLDFVVNPESAPEGAFKNLSFDIYNKLRQAYELREKQTDYLMEMLKSCPHKIILTGDFNDTPSSWVYKQISKNLNDSFRRKGSGFSPTYAGPLPFLRIDYIFADKDFKILYNDRTRLNYSDHYPVIATISTD